VDADGEKEKQMASNQNSQSVWKSEGYGPARRADGRYRDPFYHDDGHREPFMEDQPSVLARIIATMRRGLRGRTRIADSVEMDAGKR
jgi:hypothetical protein